MDNSGDKKEDLEQIKNMSPGDVLKNFGVYGVRTLLINRGYPANEIDAEIMGSDSNQYGRPSEATPLGIVDNMINVKKKELDGLMINSPVESERKVERSLYEKTQTEIDELTGIKDRYKQGDVKPIQKLLMDLKERTLSSFSYHIQLQGAGVAQKYIPGRHKGPVSIFGAIRDYEENIKIKLSINKAVQFATIQRGLSQIIKPIEQSKI